MADQTGDVIQFIWDKHPEFDIETISKCVAAMGEWVEAQTDADAVRRDSGD